MAIPIGEAVSDVVDAIAMVVRQFNRREEIRRRVREREECQERTKGEVVALSRRRFFFLFALR